jgi:hypothetical protein
MEIDISAYLSEEDKQRIAEEEYRKVIRSIVYTDKERLFSNAAYRTVQKLVDERFGESLSKILEEKTVKIINDLSTYTVFKKKDAWDNDDSKGWKYLQESVDKHKDLIEDRVVQIIQEVDSDYVRNRLEDLMCEVVENRLLGKSFKKEDNNEL